MKRIGTILSLSVLVVLLASSISFAGDLTLVNIYPKEGENGLQPTNVAVKMTFSENMTDAATQAANEGRFRITNDKGKTVEFNALYNAKKYPNDIWLQVVKPLEADTTYTLTISKDLQSSEGNTLNEPIVTHFAARNTEADNTGYMVLMVLMMVGMVGFTVWETGRKAKKESEKPEEDKKINPYKEARKTGKSVEEIVAKAEQEKAKLEKQRAKENQKQGADAEDEKARDGVYKLKAKRPISSIGAATPQKIIAMKLAREEAKAQAAQAKGKKNQPAAKSKGSKQQQKKKK